MGDECLGSGRRRDTLDAHAERACGSRTGTKAGGSDVGGAASRASVQDLSSGLVDVVEMSLGDMVRRQRVAESVLPRTMVRALLIHARFGGQLVRGRALRRRGAWCSILMLEQRLFHFWRWRCVRSRPAKLLEALLRLPRLVRACGLRFDFAPRVTSRNGSARRDIADGRANL